MTMPWLAWRKLERRQRGLLSEALAAARCRYLRVLEITGQLMSKQSGPSTRFAGALQAPRARRSAHSTVASVEHY